MEKRTTKKKVIKTDSDLVEVIAKVRIGTEEGTCRIGDVIKLPRDRARQLQDLNKIKVVL